MSLQLFSSNTVTQTQYVVRTSSWEPMSDALVTESLISNRVTTGAWFVTVTPTVPPPWDEPLSPANAWPRLSTSAKNRNPVTRERRSGTLTKSLMHRDVRRTVLKPRAMGINADSDITGRGRARGPSTAGSDVAEDREEEGNRGDVERCREEDRQVVVARGHQDPAEDRRHAIREAPDDRVDGAGEPALLRFNDPHEEGVADRCGHVHERRADEVQAAREDRIRREGEAQHEGGRQALRHDDRADGTVPFRERRAADRRDPDRHVPEREERPPPRVLDGELEQHPRRHERDEEPGPEADEPVDAGELQEGPPVHRLRPGLTRPHGFPIAAQEKVEGNRHEEPERVRDDEGADVDRVAVNPGRSLEGGERQRQSEARPRRDVVQDERQRERGVPLLDRCLIGDDRVPRGQERTFPNPRDDRGGDEPPEVRREGEHEHRRRQDHGRDQEEPLPTATVRVDPEGDRAQDNRHTLGAEEEANDLGPDADLREVGPDEHVEVAEADAAEYVREHDPTDLPRDPGKPEPTADGRWFRSR